MKDPILELYEQKWQLTSDGASFSTHSSLLQPCIYNGTKAVLKIPFEEEELRASKLMQWWDGNAAARVLKLDGKAILLERIENEGNLSLVSLVKEGKDCEATEIICRTANKLHRSPTKELPPLVSLTDWFAPLLTSRHFSDEVLKESALIADRLLAHQTECCVLHGDIHHENILYSDEHGWLAIDPKALYGDRAFDFANILCNPSKEIALADGRLAAQLGVIRQAANIECDRMLDWLIAWVGLSAIWLEEDGLDADLIIKLAKSAWAFKKTGGL